jgi:hypothetical protein
MDGKDEELIFDFLAAAEDTGKRLDLLVRQVPGHIKAAVATALADEWRKVTVFRDVSEATGKFNDAIGEVRESVALLRRTIRTAIAVGVAVAVAIPVVTWLIMNGW